ncbi:hypothetical protein SAMN06264364_12128 [Quadrisphaera granulorum]|uniref:Uncharacterized protein n=1 Tax=Quadrisphaera granulorum TaxID=317664 RepID=A0A315ZZY6_9ACTN|nr:hypothetical protein [Quadrisphaera granulorum]PWJ51151.1 hypothetical protein BXY45_12128 [Quadrisphaera granulorum]SZE97801.1 hypothetical protein SAMN06264364_12128 [Quadrisphaera granulorum]
MTQTTRNAPFVRKATEVAPCTPVDDDDAPPGLYLTGLLVDPAWRRQGPGEPFTGGVGVLVRWDPSGAP